MEKYFKNSVQIHNLLKKYNKVIGHPVLLMFTNLCRQQYKMLKTQHFQVPDADQLEKEVLTLEEDLEKLDENLMKATDYENIEKILDADIDRILQISESEGDTPWEKEIKMFRLNRYITKFTLKQLINLPFAVKQKNTRTEQNY